MVNRKGPRQGGAGQSTVEYILLVTAVIAVIITITTGPFTTKLTDTLNKTTDGMGNMADRLMGAINP